MVSELPPDRPSVTPGGGFRRPEGLRKEFVVGGFVMLAGFIVGDIEFRQGVAATEEPVNRSAATTPYRASQPDNDPNSKEWPE